MTPRVSVVVNAHNRPEGIARTLAALRAQTLPADEFEVIVVDDGSAQPTRDVLAREAERPGPEVRVLRNETPRGVGGARNVGWRAARAPLVASTDDDCEPTPRWLESGLEAWASDPKRFVQGPIRPDPHSEIPLGPLARTLENSQLGPWWQAANMFYPRAGLEEVGGLDEEHFAPYGGEDTDVGWRLIAAGYTPAWAPGAVVHHEIAYIGARRKLKAAWGWSNTMLNFKRHPQLRDHLKLGVFWIPTHWYLLRAALALALPSRLWWLRWWLAAPYVARLGTPRPDIAAVVVATDVIEIAACARGSLRHRTLVL